MTKTQARLLPNGLYRLFWKEGGFSLASVGRLNDGTPWFAPTNWVSKLSESIASTDWRRIDHVEQMRTG